MDKSINKVLIGVGVILIPFYEIWIRVLPYAYTHTLDTRQAKSFMAIWIALIIGLVAIYQGNIKKFNNKWIVIFVGYLLLSSHLGFATPFQMNKVESGGFWVWQPLFQVICFFLMAVSVASMEFKRTETDLLLKIMAWCGLIMSFYIVFHYFDIRQFYGVKNTNQATATTNFQLTGSLGQPTLAAPYIAMIIPITLYLKKYLWVVLMIAVVLLINSQVATVGMIVALIVYSGVRWPKSLIVTVSIAILGVFIVFKTGYSIELSGRGEAWTQIIEYWRNPPVQGEIGNYSITGKGLGSFEYFYHEIYRSVFFKAHNEYLQILSSLGIIGLGLFLLSMAEIRKNINFRMGASVALVSSLVCISVCAGGTFVWQLGVYQFMSVLIYGLLCNKSIQGGLV